MNELICWSFPISLNLSYTYNIITNNLNDIVLITYQLLRED